MRNSDGALERIGDFVSSFGKGSSVPVSVLDRMRMSLLDSVGCGIFGASLPWSKVLRDTMVSLGNRGECGIFGSRKTVTPEVGALINGAAIHGFELDDLHRESIVHLGSVVVPVTMALSASRRIDGARLLDAMAVGYEIGARVGMAGGTSHLMRGFHPTGTHGVIAAAATAAFLLGLGAEKAMHSIAIAATQASGLMSAQYGSMVKRFHAGHAAHTGIVSAYLAANGYTGSLTVLSDGYGAYGPTLGADQATGTFLDDLGESWEAERIGYKLYPTNGSCQPAIFALLKMLKRYSFTVTDVFGVEVQTSTATKEHVGWEFRPTDVTSAQMNLPYILAVTLRDQACGITQFSLDNVMDPKLSALSQIVKVEADSEIDNLGQRGRHFTRLIVRLRDGRTLMGEERYAPGSIDAPVDWPILGEKMHSICDAIMPTGQIDEIIGNVEEIQSSDDVISLFEMVYK